MTSPNKETRHWTLRAIKVLPYPEPHSKTQDLDGFILQASTEVPDNQKTDDFWRYEKHLIQNYGRDACRKAKFIAKETQSGDTPRLRIISMEMDLQTQQRREFWIIVGIVIALTLPSLAKFLNFVIALTLPFLTRLLNF